MNKGSMLASAAVTVLLIAGRSIVMAQQPAAPSPNAAAPVPYTLSMGDMMNTLVQPRHAKLGLAGRAENWPLATYALVEIRQVFAGIKKAQPRFRRHAGGGAG